jgi:hypothetical protein
MMVVFEDNRESFRSEPATGAEGKLEAAASRYGDQSE